MNDIEKRFWSKVIVKTRKECWEWKGSKDKDGYGVFWIKPQNQRAHKMSFEFEFGKIKDKKWVLHHCDNPPCVNPYHLFIGTNQDNIKDKVAKKRQPFGENHHLAKLTVDEVKQIKALLLKSDLSSSVIAKQFKVSKGTIKDIKALRSWTHITL